MQPLTIHEITESRQALTLPTHLTECAKILWRGREEEFYTTNCEITYLAIDSLIRRRMGDVVMRYSLTRPTTEVYGVIFGEGITIERGGEEHYMFVVGRKVYQSYAFVSTVVETELVDGKEMWEYVVGDKERYRGMDLLYEEYLMDSV